MANRVDDWVNIPVGDDDWVDVSTSTPVPGPTVDEGGFQKWYSDWADKTGLDPNPDDPRHKYDYRAAYTAGARPEISPEDNKYHWPSQFKALDHPNRFVGGVDTITGQPAPDPTPTTSEPDQRGIPSFPGGGGGEFRGQGATGSWEDPKGFFKRFIEKPEEKIPGLGIPIMAAKAVRVAGAFQRTFDNYDYRQPISPESMMPGAMGIKPALYTTRKKDIGDIENYLIDAARESTIGGTAGDILSRMPAFAINFMITGGSAKLGTMAGKKALTTLLRQYATTTAGKAAIATGGFAVGAAFRATAMPDRAIESILKRQIPDDMQISDSGVVSGTVEKPFTSIWKGLADHYIEIASEQAGEVIAPVASKVFRKLPLMGKLTGALQKKWIGLKPGRTIPDFKKVIGTKLGFHGIIGEVGEEYLGNITRAITDVEHFGAGEGAGIIERIGAAVEQDTKNLPAMILAFSVPSAAVSVAGRVAGQAVEAGEAPTEPQVPTEPQTPINVYKTTSGSRTGITEQEIVREGERYVDSVTGEDVVLDVEASGSAVAQAAAVQAVEPTPVEPTPTEPAPVAGEPITKIEKDQLRDQGYGVSDILKIDPTEARGILGIEEAPALPQPPKITRKKALTLGHTLPDLLEWDEAQRREFMQQTVGQTTMKGMKLADMRTLVEALQGEVRAAGLEYTPPTPPVDELVSTLAETKKITELEPAEELKAGRIRQLGRRIKSGAYSFVTGLERMERFFESLDAHKKGAFSKHIWEPVRQADELSTENANQDLDEFMVHLEDQGVDTALWLGKTEDIGKWSLTPFQKIGVYMLAQNKNGRRQLTKGMGMSKSDLTQIAGAMTPQETTMAEWLLEKYDQQWNVIKVVAVQSGMDPAKLKKELRYSPIMRTDADLETQEDFLSGIIEGFTGEKYDPEHKFLEERKPGAAGKVELDAAILYMHNIARTNRFIQFAPTANSIGKILNNRKFKQALNERTYGQGSRLINKWMKDSVRGTTAHTTGWLSKAANVMRRNGIVYAIGYNIPSSLRQSLSLSNAVAVDKAMLVHVPANLTRATTPKSYKEMQEFVYSRSLQVKNASYDRDLRTKANKAGLKLKLRGKRQWSQKAISWIRWMDRHTRVVAWKSLYDTGMGKFNDETKAMEYADKWVARTQPMANMKDLPDFFRGGTFEKLLTTFQNQVNNNANFYIYDILGAKKAGEITNTEAAHRVMFSYVLPAVLFGMIGRGGLPKDVKQIAVDLATYPLAGVVVLGRWITRMIQGWGGSTTIAGVAPEEAGKLVGAAKRGDIPNIIKHAVTTVGAATGRIPAQAIRTAEGVADIAAGETEDPRRLIWSEWALKQGKKKKKKTRYGGGYLK